MSVIQCVVCNAIFEPPVRTACCPKCETRLLPVNPADEVQVFINWNVLRCFVMWAERWASQAKDPYMVRMVRNQAAALSAQHPDRAKSLPLTFIEEVQQLRETFGEVDQNVVTEEDD